MKTDDYTGHFKQYTHTVPVIMIHSKNGTC